MTPPGDSLDFHSSSAYRARTKTAPDVNVAIQEAIRNRPSAGITLAGAARQFSVMIGKESYVVFYTHKGNSIGLVAIFDAVDEAEIEIKRQELRALFSKGGHK